MSRAGQKMQQTISLSISDYHRQRERDRKRREILEYDNKTHGAGGCRLGGADRKRQLHTALEQTGIFGCHEASGEYHACGTGGWRDTGVSVHVCVI